MFFQLLVFQLHFHGVHPFTEDLLYCINPVLYNPPIVCPSDANNFMVTNIVNYTDINQWKSYMWVPSTLDL